MAPDTRGYDVAQRLLECACEALDETEAGCPDRACVINGAIAWDNCQCGQLTVAMQTAYASSNFPTPAATTATTFGAAKCGHPIVARTYMVTILRCAPTSDDHGNPPSCEDLSEAAATADEDASAVYSAIQCCLADMFATRDEQGRRLIMGWSVGTQNFVGPEGYCAGSQFPVTVGLLNQCACGD